jgi:hypothetical protein
MNTVDRAKNIILKPNEEWNVINQENTSAITLVVTYLIPLALIPAVATLIGYSLRGADFFGFWALKHAVILFITIIIGVFISALVFNKVAPNFGSTKNFRKAMQLAVYSYTPVMLAGAFSAIPAISILGIVGLYGLYLLYSGIKPLMKTPNDKVGIYFLVSFLVIIAVNAIFYAILSKIFIGSVVSMPVMR